MISALDNDPLLPFIFAAGLPWHNCPDHRKTSKGTNGIRENTAITRVSVYGDILDAIGEIDRLTIVDPELDRLVSTLFEGSTETPTESQRRTVRTYLNALLLEFSAC